MYIKQPTNILQTIGTECSQPSKTESSMDLNFSSLKNHESSSQQICLKCFTPLTLYQLNFDEALKICANPQCIQIPCLTEISQRTYKNTLPITEKFNSFNTEDKFVLADNLNFVLNFYINTEIQRIENLISKFDQKKQEGDALFDQNDEIISFDQMFTNTQTFNESEETIQDDLFDENFLNEIANIEFDNTNSTQIGVVDSFKSFLTNQHNDSVVLTDLQPIKEEDLASQITNDLLESDFLNVEPYPEVLATFSQTGSSSISIQKVEKPRCEIKFSNLKVIDEKEGLMELIDSSKKCLFDKKIEQKPIKKSTPGLLPWEVKNKLKPKSRIESKQTEILKSKKEESKIPRVEAKSNLTGVNLNELSSVLKQKKWIDENTISGKSLKTSTPTSGGYKDLVLSVLKKKTSTT